MIVTTPVAKEALRAQVLRLLPNVAPYWEKEERDYVETRIASCAWLKKNRTYERALKREEEYRWSPIWIFRSRKQARIEEYKSLLIACDNAVDVVHLDFETLRRVFG